MMTKNLRLASVTGFGLAVGGLGLLLLLSFLPIRLVAQEHAKYENSAEGLRAFLEDVHTSAQKGDAATVLNFIKQTEIPAYRDWFYRMYAADKAESWVQSYGRELPRRQQSFQQLMLRLPHEDGHFVVRKVNDNPEPGKGLEWGMLHSAREPLDIYFAAWSPSKRKDSPIQRVGYFYYIDGMFRWDSQIIFLPMTVTAK